ncbi:MAG TPA: exosortase/archaeosortase family protein [Myxococcota bacterium]|jgi:exosortase|nr:exosortase/archaeosortase family protein [Myxococcota bacterium]
MASGTSEGVQDEARASRAAPGPRPREIGLLALLLVAFAPALVEMAHAWSTREEYSHGFLVPAVSLWAILRDRKRLARIAIRNDTAGLWLLLGALVLHALGSAAGLVEVSGLALVAALAGGVWWLRGAHSLRALAFPIGFLVFLIPLPEAWLAPVVVELRLFVTKGAVAVLHAFAVPVASEGNVLLLPGGGELFVADACSGVTSLVTLTPLAVMLACFTERTLGRRLAIVAAVVPIALAGNLLRVIGTVLVARRFGVEAATEASAHQAAGLVAYVLGCLALLGVGAAMRRLWPER